jgi:hypothetical protein
MLYSRGYNTMKSGWWWGLEVDHNGFYPLLSERINKSIPGVGFSNNSLGQTDCGSRIVCGAGSLIFSPPHPLFQPRWFSGLVLYLTLYKVVFLWAQPMQFTA